VRAFAAAFGTEPQVICADLRALGYAASIQRDPYSPAPLPPLEGRLDL
jgi:hypothetical protein